MNIDTIGRRHTKQTKAIKRRLKTLEEILADEQPGRRKQKLQSQYEDLLGIMCIQNRE